MSSDDLPERVYVVIYRQAVRPHAGALCPDDRCNCPLVASTARTFYSAYGNSTPSLYDRPAPARNTVARLERAGEFDAKIMFLDTVDLRTWTDDGDVRLQEREAGMLRAAEDTDALAKGVAPVLGAAKKPKRRRPRGAQLKL